MTIITKAFIVLCVPSQQFTTAPAGRPLLIEAIDLVYILAHQTTKHHCTPRLPPATSNALDQSISSPLDYGTYYPCAIAQPTATWFLDRPTASLHVQAVLYGTVSEYATSAIGVCTEKSIDTMHPRSADRSWTSNCTRPYVYAAAGGRPD
jgi:hypothetical protein